MARRSGAPARRRACARRRTCRDRRPRRVGRRAVLTIAATVSSGVGSASVRAGLSVFVEEEARVVDDRELLVLVLGNEDLQRLRLGRPRAALSVLSASAEAWRKIVRQDLDRVRAGVRIAHQIEQRRDGFALLERRLSGLKSKLRPQKQRRGRGSPRQGSSRRPSCAAARGNGRAAQGHAQPIGGRSPAGFSAASSAGSRRRSWSGRRRSCRFRRSARARKGRR